MGFAHMNFGLDEQQEMLRNVARGFLAKECPEQLVCEMEEDAKGYSPELWRKMAQQGWMGLVIPEQHGGVGMKLCELVVLLEEFGPALAPWRGAPTSPLLSWAPRPSWSLQENEPDADAAVSMAKAWCSNASRRVVAHGQQIHGAIGFTRDYKIQLYFRRQKWMELIWGDTRYHRELVAQKLEV